jgi:hypothetical protein
LGVQRLSERRNEWTENVLPQFAYAGANKYVLWNVDVSASLNYQYPWPSGSSGYGWSSFTVQGKFSDLPRGKVQLWEENYESTGWVYSTSYLDYWIDQPDHMIVISDFTGLPDSSHPNVWRQVIYEVRNTSEAIAPQINVGEDFAYTQSSPPCNGNIVMHTSSCSQTVPAITTTYGRFTDQWAITTAATPAGCGISNVVDKWEACSPNYVDGYGTKLPILPFAKLAGYTHTNEVDILGYVAPPTTVKMPVGKVITP